MSIIAELRSAARGLARSPTLSLAALVCLALGLGGTSAISSAIDRVLIRSLPFRSPDRLVTVYRTNPKYSTLPISVPTYLDLVREARQFEGLAAIARKTGLLALPDRGTEVRVIRATGNLLPLLGPRGILGRVINSADDSVSAAPVAVLSTELWREAFGGDPSMLGRTIRLDGVERTVVGILPYGFAVPHGQEVLRADVWIPSQFTAVERSRRFYNYLTVFGRLAPAATLASGEAELRASFVGLLARYPELQGEGFRGATMKQDGVQGVRTPLLLLFGAALAVLAIASVNVASLLLARGFARRREMAVRTALGGGRWEVMRPVLVESLLLATTGGLLGLGLAWLGVRAISALAVAQLPQLSGISVDLRIVAFAIVLVMVVAGVAGVIPAWRTTAIDPGEAMGGGRGSSSGRGQHRVLSALVITELALSLTFLVGAGLVLRGFAALTHKNPGFDLTKILTLETSVAPDRYNGDSVILRRFLDPVLARIGQLPGVAGVGSIHCLPYACWASNFGARYEGQPDVEISKRPTVEERAVSPGYVQAMGMRLVRGRLLRDNDDGRPSTPRVALVNEALVARDFAGRDPVGTRFRAGNDYEMVTIVGVVSNVRNYGPIADPVPEAYFPYAQDGLDDRMPIVVRTKGMDPTAIIPAVRAIIHEIDPQAAVSRVQPMTAVMAQSVGTPRFYLTLLATFALVALVLAVAGLYGVMSYVVVQRTRELGIRSALGSSTSGIVGLVSWRGLRLITTGMLVGVLGAAALTRVLGTMLYGVSPLDTRAWLLTTATLAVAGLLATLVPAIRAACVDPVIAMRVE
jgi:putative ABC transport system permease protein